MNDTIRALKGLMDSTETTGEIYNVGSRNWISVVELPGASSSSRSRSPSSSVPYDKVYGTGIDDMLHRVPAIEKIERRHRLDADTLARRHPRTT